MPIFHTQIQGQGVQPNGQTVNLPPPILMQQRGPVAQVSVGIAQVYAQSLTAAGTPVPAPVSGWALIDTGASMTCIDDAIAQKLGLPAIDRAKMASASHAGTECNVYPISFNIIGLPIQMELHRAIGANLQSQGLAMLIGRDLLMRCTLHYNGLTGEFTIAM
ncbi:MAG TPA: retroviral-like aspartic protease family protein [Bryobacteraceae bacterium]|nr:retroviral-like aspartic protease family protein [Bryobacteraceae bacterium]